MARTLNRLLLAAFGLMLALAAGAQSDPPDRVGRIALIGGEVALSSADLPEWQDARVNWPITTQDMLHTGPASHAEIRIGSTTLRLGGSTEIHVLQLDDERIWVWLEYGNLAVRVRSPDPAAAVLVETRDGRVATGEPGRYRIDYAHAATTLTAESGRLEFESADSRTTVPAGRRAEIWIAGDTQYRWGYPLEDEFSRWVLARDRADDDLGQPRYVSPEMTGAEELAAHGNWRHYPDYGPVWYPHHVPVGWAPYRSGSWAWVSPWGWTWIDDAPWGFAPFHYGRWTHIHGRWAWVPGAYVARPVYAPALVAWIGSPGWSVSFAFGHQPAVGWFPLAPGEVFIPAFHASPVFVRKVNITHVTTVTHITHVVREPHRVRHRFRDHRDAVTIVPQDAFRQGRPASRHAVRDPQRWLRDATIATAAPVEEGRRFRDEAARQRWQQLDETRQRRFGDDQARRSTRVRTQAAATESAASDAAVAVGADPRRVRSAPSSAPNPATGSRSERFADGRFRGDRETEGRSARPGGDQAGLVDGARLQAEAQRRAERQRAAEQPQQPGEVLIAPTRELDRRQRADALRRDLQRLENEREQGRGADRRALDEEESRRREANERRQRMESLRQDLHRAPERDRPAERRAVPDRSTGSDPRVGAALVRRPAETTERLRSGATVRAEAQRQEAERSRLVERQRQQAAADTRRAQEAAQRGLRTAVPRTEVQQRRDPGRERLQEQRRPSAGTFDRAATRSASGQDGDSRRGGRMRSAPVVGDDGSDSGASTGGRARQFREGERRSGRGGS